MIQDYQIITNQINGFPANSGSPIQKIFSTARYLAISLRSPGKTHWIYLGRGAGFEGLWFGDKPPESSLRVVKDQLLQYVRKYLSGGIFHSIELDKSDRIIKINFIKWGQINSFFYFYRGRESIFASRLFEDTKEINFSSYHGYVDREIDFDLFDEIGRAELESKKSNRKNLELLDLLEKEKKDRSLNNVKRTKFIKRKVKNIEGDLTKMLSIPKVEQTVNSWMLRLQNNEEVSELIDVSKVMLNGFKFKFAKDISSFKKVDIIFQKIKRLKKAKELLTRRLNESKGMLIETKRDDLKLSQKIILPIWNRKKLKVKEKLNADYIEVELDNYKVVIGKDARSNDHLRKSWAKKNDWWFHIENQPSAHAYVKDSLGLGVNPEFCKKIARQLRTATKLESSEVSIIYTQVKNLKGVKGVAGSVFFKKEKRITCYID